MPLMARPVSVRIDTFGTGMIAESKLQEAVRQIFDLRPAGIIQMLDLKRQSIVRQLLMAIWVDRY